MAQEQSLQAGVQQTWFMFYDINGDPAGVNTTPLTNGQISGSYFLRGIQEAPSATPESDAVPIPGDDTVLGQIIFSSDSPREFVLSFGQRDLVAEARMQSTAVQTVGGIKVGTLDTPDQVLATGALITQSMAIIDGRAAWSGTIYPLVQIQPLGRETSAGRTAGVIRYKGVAQLAFNDTWGTTIVNASGSPISAYSQPFTSFKPITFDALRGDGTLNPVFLLNKAPVSVARTSPFVDKVAVALTSVGTPNARSMTVNGTIGSGRPGVVVYEY